MHRLILPDPHQPAAAFAARGRARIDGVLEPDLAQRLYACLSQDVPWQFVYNEGGLVRKIDPQQQRRLNAADLQKLNRDIQARARDGFQFAYHCYPMLDAYLAGADPGLPLHRLLEMLNSPPLLDLVRTVSGIPSLAKADAQATWFRPGNFLTQHDDRGEAAEQRRVAYVLNLTRRWRADWGGLLQFHGPDGDVAEAWLPRFNSLVLFRVPVLHSVSQVATFAGQPRFAVTGWFRDG